MGGDGMVHSSAADGTRTFSHSNHRGDVIGRSDSSRSLTSFALYEAYGTRPYEWGDDPDRQKANTKEEESDLGLLNEGMRFRDLETGVFLTRDPIGYADGPNVYCYVHCNPITHFDAFGLATDGRVTFAADIVGIFDPSPATDLANASYYFSQGENFDGVMTALGVVPIVGDVVGKGGKYAVKGVRKGIEAATPLVKKGMRAAKPYLKRAGKAVGRKADAAKKWVGGLFKKKGDDLGQAATKNADQATETIVTEGGQLPPTGQPPNSINVTKQPDGQKGRTKGSVLEY